MPVAGTSNSALIKSTAVGTILQLIMVIVGHYSPAISNQFAAGGTAISGVAGLLFSVWSGQRTTGVALGGGLAAGGICAFLGILVSYILGDVSAPVLGYGTAASALAGAIGGLIGRMLAPKTA